MLTRISIKGYKCLENIEFNLGPGSFPFLLIGSNGSGKSAFRSAMQLIRDVCRGGIPVGDLISIFDTNETTHPLVEFEVGLRLEERIFVYKLSLHADEEVFRESFELNGTLLFSRSDRSISFPKNGSMNGAASPPLHIGEDYPALPMLKPLGDKSVEQFCRFFTNAWIMAPEPSKITGRTKGERNVLSASCSTISDVVFEAVQKNEGLLQDIEKHLSLYMPDCKRIHFTELEARKSYHLNLEFGNEGQRYDTYLERLSDGQKCFFVASALAAFTDRGLVTFCFWDEPDNFLSLDEVQRFIRQLRRLKHQLPFIMTSHHPETMRSFPDENIFVLRRDSQVSATRLQQATQIDRVYSDLIESVVHGEVY